MDGKPPPPPSTNYDISTHHTKTLRTLYPILFPFVMTGESWSKVRNRCSAELNVATERAILIMDKFWPSVEREAAGTWKARIKNRINHLAKNKFPVVNTGA